MTEKQIGARSAARLGGLSVKTVRSGDLRGDVPRAEAMSEHSWGSFVCGMIAGACFAVAGSALGTMIGKYQVVDVAEPACVSEAP